MTARAAAWLATGFGAGYLPIAPGTWGSLLAIVAATGLVGTEQALPVLAAAVVASTVLGIWAAGRVAADLGDSDPSRVVIDEVAGQFLTLIWVPLSVSSLVAGFLLFRIFDVVKPPPARQAESLPGGYGIMMDDLVAGLYAGMCLLLARWLGWIA